MLRLPVFYWTWRWNDFSPRRASCFRFIDNVNPKYRGIFSLLHGHGSSMNLLLTERGGRPWEGRLSARFLRRGRQQEECISHARIVLSPRFLYYSSLMEKRYLAMWMCLCEGKLKVKIAHFLLLSASQKRSCLSSLILARGRGSLDRAERGRYKNRPRANIPLCRSSKLG